jgi:hypothetical protein
MVDKTSRHCLFLLLKRVATGRIRAFECENQLLVLATQDGVVKAISITIRELIPDDDSTLAGIFVRRSEMRARLARWLLFLKSDFRYQWPETMLPAGILDYYRPTAWDGITGAKVRIENEIRLFCSAGDYGCWPFYSQSEFEHFRRGAGIQGLRIGKG